MRVRVSINDISVIGFEKIPCSFWFMGSIVVGVVRSAYPTFALGSDDGSLDSSSLARVVGLGIYPFAGNLLRYDFAVSRVVLEAKRTTSEWSVLTFCS